MSKWYKQGRINMLSINRKFEPKFIQISILNI